MEHLDQLTALRILSRQQFYGLHPWTPRVLLRIPLRGGHLGKERLHLLGIVEQLAVQVAGVPIDKDAT